MADFVLDPKKYEGHTQGPWHRHSQVRDAVNAGKKHVAMVNCGQSHDPEKHITDSELKANVWLVADAPAILAEAIALQARVEQLEAENKETFRALKLLVNLNDDYSPFMGEIGRDRVERTWEHAKAIYAKYKPEEGEQQDED